MRFSLRQIITATFGLAALLVIVEHAGGFSQVLESGAVAYGTGFQAITGHYKSPLGGYAPGQALYSGAAPTGTRA